MSIFDQSGQQVTNQYNAAGDINFGAVQNRTDLVGELQKIKAELPKATQAGVIDEEKETEATYQVTKAIQQAQKPEPDKMTIVDHLNKAKDVLVDVTAAGTMVTALAQAMDLVHKLF